MRALVPVIAILATVLLILSQTLYTVDQRQFALIVQLGEIVNVREAPGLYAKIPLLQNVKYFERRILTLDSADAERFQTAEKKNVLVDSFVKWRIVDVQQFLKAVAGDEERAKKRLEQAINDNLRAEFGKRTINEVVSGERSKIMGIVREKADRDAKSIGVEIVDVRLKRVDLPQEVSDAVYRRMEAERKRVANELRSTGSAEAESIRADADKQAAVIKADAFKEAQQIRGEGDAKASAVYAAAFGQNPEFYTFYRSLEAYKQSFRSKNDVLVLEPNAEFFKYLKGNTAKAAK